MFYPIVIMFLTFAALCALLVLGWVVVLAVRAKDEAEPNHFIVPPYVQLGRNPQYGPKRSLEILWHGEGTADNWFVQIATESGESKGVVIPTATPIDFPAANPKIPAHSQFRVVVKNLNPGERIRYRVHHEGADVFTAEVQAPLAENSPHRFVLAGDIAKWGVDERRIAAGIASVDPDLFIIPGDAVYNDGRLSEYMQRFFPVMNNDVQSEGTGAPIMRSVLTVLAPGNHCVGRPEPHIEPDLDWHADLFGYFVYWSQPLNGTTSPVAYRSYSQLKGSEKRKRAFIAAAGEKFPRMLNFSFDYGDAHWVVLDSNLYTDWSNPEVREWLEKDLASTKRNWKFVVYHHSAFHTNRKHQDGVRMRLISDLLEKYKVDVVFTGHVHTYERTHPIKFTLRRGENQEALLDEFGRPTGDIVIDRNYDGVKNTKPDGIIYVVSGAGGATLHSEGVPDELKPHTAKVIAFRHSYTVSDVDGDTLTVRQFSASGQELDRFVITK